MANHKPQVLLITSLFNAPVTEKLKEGARKVLQERDVLRCDEMEVQGAWEIPYAVKQKLMETRYDFVVVLGAIIQGETEHHHYLAESVYQGLMHLSLTVPVPIGLGILTVTTAAQAYARTGGKKGNYGANAAQAAYDLWLKFKEKS